MTKTKKTKILVASSMYASEEEFQYMDLEDIKDEMVFTYSSPSKSKTLYEVIHPSKNRWIKPYFDIDDNLYSIFASIFLRK